MKLKFANLPKSTYLYIQKKSSTIEQHDSFCFCYDEGKKKKDQYVNTIDDVERITGIDFFPALPDSIENEVEAYANLDDWR
jgi:DNA/RNA endonuclease G (NUC1)